MTRDFGPPQARCAAVVVSQNFVILAKETHGSELHR